MIRVGLVKPAVTADTVAQLLEVFVREWRACMYSGGLNPAQWTALRYFARVEPEVSTLSEFARFHATTLGTASQTISSLQHKRLIVRFRNPANRRQRTVRVTDLGRELLTEDPFINLVNFVDSISDAEKIRHSIFIKNAIISLYGK